MKILLFWNNSTPNTNSNGWTRSNNWLVSTFASSYVSSPHSMKIYGGYGATTATYDCGSCTEIMFLIQFEKELMKIHPLGINYLLNIMTVQATKH